MSHPDHAHDLRGLALLHHAGDNKSTAFTHEERERHGLRGLLPAQEHGMDVQVTRVLGNLRRKRLDIERYIFLSALQNRNERLFYRTVIDHIEEIMPLIYTPTVGEASKEFANIFREPKGFYITPDDRGEIRRMLDNWPERDIRVIVVTDGERILGLGDLGANGMGIPIGKLALYCAGAGIHPHQCLPVMLDVGTNNEPLANSALYLGIRGPRLTGPAYDDLVEEFVEAVQDAYPRALIQFEDFLTPNAYRLLHRYRDRVLSFNDDIQGTAAVALAGVYASTRISGQDFRNLRILFLGAGSAATGIADLLTYAFVEDGLPMAEARRRLWFADRSGLLVQGRDRLAPHNRPYAHEHPPATFLEAIDSIRPHVLIGATGHGGAFDEESIRRLASHHARPTIFALSNPTANAECTAEQAYQWSDGRALFASGSPFDPVTFGDETFRPGQGNNVYIFPGVGLGALVSEARSITEEMFLAAAKALASCVDAERDLAVGALYPPLPTLRDVSRAVARATADVAFEQGLARCSRPASLERTIADFMYEPTYDKQRSGEDAPGR